MLVDYEDYHLMGEHPDVEQLRVVEDQRVLARALDQWLETKDYSVEAVEIATEIVEAMKDEALEYTE